MWNFSVGGGGQIRNQQRYGGPKSLLLGKFTMLLFLPPKGGPNSIANFYGGPWPDLPPPGSATASRYTIVESSSKDGNVLD